MKKFSVIIPTYKVEKYIAAAIESVLAQTYQNFEIIVVNDDSPDRSVEICQQFTDSRIKIVSQKNRGLAGARNTGIRHAQGDYIALLDGDDLWLPEKLEKHVEHLESSSSVGISFSRSAFIDEAGNSLGTYLMPKLKEITSPDLLRDNPVGNGSAAVIRKEVLEAIKFQDNLYGTVENFYFDDHFRQAEDIECWLRIVLQTNWKIEGISEALTLYRVNSGGLSASLLNQFEALQKVIEKTRSYAPELIAQWENPTKAYQLRYLARSAVRLKAGSMAVQLMHQALAAHWRLVLEQPRRTLMTLAAAYMLWLLPQPLYAQIEAVAAKMTAATQKRRILQEHSGQSI
ncbi:glycosyltransferase [Funiculus sociatus GB2-A5]|uniref:Glycosyltransferase n=1 Tax=Funiculus sociatus GB2-A5 TaxID=2933946 RepID=A0ABV0JKC1_9CYAN|nr:MULTISPECIES: glycosyltransferase family 2 protein [unclassified Trichocoleus]MBD1906886.1 glycosyltransferase family 2 protein [Trichocoleus sp. FACHB-832]MBD2060941.1 glycosyltransferase family 2 protein [Trichocoleus sp. FACHB-6]